MNSSHAILIALLVLLIAIVVWGMYGPGRGKKCEGFGPAPLPHHTAYDLIHRQIGAIRGVRNDGYNQPFPLNSVAAIDRYHRYGANLKPEDISKAERTAWFMSGELGHTSFDNEQVFDPAAAITTWHATKEGMNGGMDYGSYITDLISDPRTRENHGRWVDEMKPWSGTSQKVDTLDEAMEATLNFQGLRRPQPVAQYNPMMLTEVDADILAVNKKFNFQG